MQAEGDVGARQFPAQDIFVPFHYRVQAGVPPPPASTEDSTSSSSAKPGVAPAYDAEKKSVVYQRCCMGEMDRFIVRNPPSLIFPAIFFFVGIATCTRKGSWKGASIRNIEHHTQTQTHTHLPQTQTHTHTHNRKYIEFIYVCDHDFVSLENACFSVETTRRKITTCLCGPRLLLEAGTTGATDGSTVAIEDSYYDMSNWCVRFRKKS
uniref:Uncharacterized protein n=1 Tax=Lotharella globosa TaxID=91324 RepID=A0A7S3YUZ9_9EUKA